MLSQTREPPAEMVADIRTRLGPICQSYPADEFSELVRQIASVRVKYEAMRAENFFESARALANERLGRHRSILDDRIAGTGR